MRGSLLITFDQIEGEIADFYRVYVNGQLRDRHYTSITNLYSTFLELGDVVFIDYPSEPTNYSIINVIRTDYTTDSENNDNGIKDIFIDSLEGYGYLSGITFTATTKPDSYKYYYNIDISQSDCLSIGTGFNNEVHRVDTQSNGRIICVGNFTSYSGVTSGRIRGLQSYGVIDNTFAIGVGFNARVLTSKILSDDKILCSGDFNEYSGSGPNLNQLVRLNSDGTLDNTFKNFNYETSNFGRAFSIGLQSDGKIITFTGNSKKVIRQNTDGSIDNTFITGSTTSITGAARSIEIQSDDKIICGGFFDNYSGQTFNNIFRLNSNGSIDNTFNIGTGFNQVVNTIQILSDNKILVGGGFTSYSGQTSNRIIRLNSNGTIDNTFNIGTGFDGSVLDIKIQPDDKILISGTFSSYNSTTSNGIIRLNSNGTIDNTFNSGTGFASVRTLWSMKLLNDGQILVGGNFTTYDGITANRIIKLNSDGSENICP